MYFSKQISLSIFVLLVLTQTAISYSFSGNNNAKHEKLYNDYVVSGLNSVENNNLKELLKNLVKIKAVNARAKADDSLKHLKSFDTNGNLNSSFSELSNPTLDAAHKNMAQRLTDIVKEELANVWPKLNNLMVNSTESHENFEDSISKFFDPKIVETYNKLTERLINLFQNKLNAVKAKFDKLVTFINSVESNKKLKDVLAELLNIKLDETYKKLTKHLLKLLKNNSADVKAEFNTSEIPLNSNEANKNWKYFVDELSNLEFDRTSKKFKKLLTTLVKQELADVKAEFDDFVNHINSIESNEKLKALLAELCNLKLDVTYKKMIENLTNIVKQELPKFTATLLQVPMADVSDNKLEDIYQNLNEGFTKLVKGKITNNDSKFNDFLTKIKAMKE